MTLFQMCLLFNLHGLLNDDLRCCAALAMPLPVLRIRAKPAPVAPLVLLENLEPLAASSTTLAAILSCSIDARATISMAFHQDFERQEFAAFAPVTPVYHVRERRTWDLPRKQLVEALRLGGRGRVHLLKTALHHHMELHQLRIHCEPERTHNKPEGMKETKATHPRKLERRQPR